MERSNNSSGIFYAVCDGTRTYCGRTRARKRERLLVCLSIVCVCVFVAIHRISNEYSHMQIDVFVHIHTYINTFARLSVDFRFLSFLSTFSLSIKQNP